MILANVIDAVEAFKSIIEKPMSGKLGFKLALILDELSKPYEIYTKKKEDLIRKYGEPAEAEGSIQVKKENIVEFNKEIGEILSTEFDVKTSLKIKLKDIENLEVEGKYIYLIRHFIDNEEEKAV